MKKIFYTISLIIIANNIKAQTAEDALKLSYNAPMGTARNMAIGGSMIGLGGEITAAHSNPAGLGFFKNGEFVLSPGFSFGKNKIDYRTNNDQKGNSVSNFNLGTSGIILAGGVNGKKLKGMALSFSVNKIADYNNYVSYKGFNNQSSGAERYAEEFVQSHLTFDDALNNKLISLPTRMAIYTYLIDTFTIAGKKDVYAMPEFTNGVNQQKTEKNSGGINEYAFSIAANKNEKLFLGASLGIPVLNNKREVIYSESDASSNTANRFGSYTYSENLKTTGTGYNLKLGLIYRPIEKFRIGATIHTPTYYNLTDRLSGTMTANTENYNGTKTVTTSQITNGIDVIESKYTFLSPWKLGIGASYVFNEIQDVKKQKAFIAADLEYVTYKTMRYSGIDGSDLSTTNFYNGTNNGIKTIYKNAINAKIGGEVKFNTIMARLGFAYYGNPNKEASTLKQNKMNLSAGLGYRNKGIFIDATYVYQMSKAIDMPYRLTDKANTFANVMGKSGMLMLTFGTKF